MKVSRLPTGRGGLLLWLLALLAGVCLGLGAWAQEPPPTDAAPETADPKGPGNLEAVAPGAKVTFDTPRPALVSPRATMRVFLTAMNAIRDDGREELWPAVFACFELEAAGIEPGSFDARRRAVQLLGVLDRIRRVDYANLPSQEELGPNRSSFTFFPRDFSDEDDELYREFELTDQHITLELGGDGRWRFSEGTIAGLPTMYDAAVSKGELKVRQDSNVSVLQPFMPRSLVTRQWLGIMYWQWVGLLVLVLLGVVVDFVCRSIVRSLLAGYIGQKRGKEHAEAITLAARPLGMFGGAAVYLLLLPMLGMPLQAHQVLHAAAAVYAVLAGTWAAWRMTDLGAEVLAAYASRTRSKIDDVLIPLFRKGLKVFVVAIGILYGADALSIPIGPMLASLGIGGLAFAFAAKDTIENFFGSVAVILDRPFEVGDWVVLPSGGGDTEGTVEELGFRSTRIRTFYNSQVTVPNASLVRATVDNYGRRKYRRWKTTLGVQYDTTPDKLIAFTEGIRELIRTHPYTRKDYYQVWGNDYGDSSLNILLYVFFEVPDWNTELRERERLFIDIVRLADQLGVQFAFPTTTVHLFTEQHAEKGAPPQPDYEPPKQTTDRRSLVKGIRAAQQLIANQPWREQKPGPQTYGQIGPTKIDEADFDPADATENTQSPPGPPPSDDREAPGRDDQTENRRDGA
jgi:MscS family membrane protein